MWLPFFYFTTIVLAIFNGQGIFFSATISKVILFLIIFSSLFFNKEYFFHLIHKKQKTNITSILFFIFILFSLYSGVRGLDITISLPLVIGLWLLYLFVIVNTQNLAVSKIEKIVVLHAIGANMLVLVTYACVFFLPSVVAFNADYFHPYGGLMRVSATSSAVVLGAILLNILSVFCVKENFSKATFLLFSFFSAGLPFLFNTRTTQVSIIFFFIAIYFYSLCFFRGKGLSNIRFKILLIFVPLLVLVLGGFYLFHHWQHMLIFTNMSTKHHRFDLDGRMELWITSLKHFFQSDLVLRGAGFGNQVYFFELGSFYYTTAHNIFLDILFETGLVGEILFALFIASSLLDVLRAFIRSRKGVYFFLFAALLALLIQSQGESSLDSLTTTNFYLYMLFYFIAVRILACE